ncbi:MAG: EamA family transporter [Acidobacteria bacterium]|nr:MAG: EamA family transporter [Acidobacteriota bacterium]
MSRSLKAHILLVLITLIWGLTFVVIKNALADVSPLFFNSIRMTLAAITLTAVFHRDLSKLTKGSLLYGVVIGALLWLGNELQTVGLKYTTPSKSAFLTGLSVVLVPVFLALFWKRKISPWSAGGVALAFAGLYLLTIPGGASGLNFRSMNHGDLLTLVAAIVFGFHIIYMGHATQANSWRQIAVIQTAVAALLMIFAVPVAEKVWVIWSGRVVAGIFLTGFLSLALAFSVQAWAQQFTPATHTALIFSLEPVFASMTSFFFLGERLGTRSAFGGLLILAGVLISEEKGATETIAVAPDHAAVPQNPGEQQVNRDVAQNR